MIKRDVCYASFSVYAMADRGLLASDADTPAHLSMTVEPVDVFDWRNRAEFLDAVKRAVARGIQSVPMPPDEDLNWDESGMPGLKEPIELRYAGVKTWEELERKSFFYSVECYERGFVVISCGRQKNGLWSDEVALELRMPAEIGVEGVVDAILENLKEREDLTGSAADISQSNTAKG